MTRTPFLAANFKMFKTVHEAVAYAKEFRALVKNLDDVEIVGAALHRALRGGRGLAQQHRLRRRPGRLLGEEAPSPAR
jgi:triosephosphate isomerase